MLKWKETRGKRATYNNLIIAFEAAGFKNFADNIRRMSGGDDDMDDSSDEESFPWPQPPTYPDQLDQPLSESCYGSSSDHECSSSSNIPVYELIDSDTAKILPKGEPCME